MRGIPWRSCVAWVELTEAGPGWEGLCEEAAGAESARRREGPRV